MTISTSPTAGPPVAGIVVRQRGPQRRAAVRRVLAPATLATLVLLLPAHGAVAADTPPEVARVSATDTVLVTAPRLGPGTDQRAVEPGADLRDLLRATPFTLVTRGATGVSDLYADGFRRQDLTFTVDCERCETACPNRMDTRAGQVDLLEIESVVMSRDGNALQSGLGGGVALRRSLPGQAWKVRGRLAAQGGHGAAYDGTVSAEGHDLRLAARWRQLEAVTDADGRTYQTLYGFARTPDTTIDEERFQARLPRGDVRVSREHSRDLLFPYLLMDERENDRWEVSGSWRGHRLYLNRTEHLMDNGLRASLGTSVMSTEAGNTMWGVVGDDYELYGRYWDADNRITPVANPAAATRSHMLPDVWRWGGTVRRAFGPSASPWLVLRLGLARTSAHDGAQLATFEKVHPGAVLARWSVPFGAVASRTVTASGAALTGSVEVTADAPGLEHQFIVVDKPGTMPDWVGNPRLDDPVRGTVRVGATRGVIRAEVFGTRALDYPNLQRLPVGGAPYQTYVGVDALLAGASVRATTRLVEAGVAWNWGEQLHTPVPLSEIQPLTFDLGVRSPTWRGVSGRADYRHAARQGRVDPAQGETATGCWNRLDLAVALSRAGLRCELALDNATNVLYTQHLSYQRNPFAAGLRVWEPGRTLRASAVLDF